MTQPNVRAGFIAVLLFTTACAQSPAVVELKGQNTYGRSTYAENGAAQPLYSYNGGHAATSSQPSYVTAMGNTTPSAAIEPISTHDLSNLSPAAGGDTPAKPVTLSDASDSKPPAAPVKVASNSPPANAINPWTGKPHFTEAEDAPDSAPPVKYTPQSKPVAQLDSIISKNTGTARLEKPAKTETAFMWPVSSKHVLSGFGPKGGGKTNDGINIAASEGEPVWAAADGEVVYVGNELAGYGNMVLIKHAGNKTTAYAHMSRATVDKYDRVKQGDIIGYVGATGNVKEPQLHFAIRDGKDPIDPSKYLSRSVASN